MLLVTCPSMFARTPSRHRFTLLVPLVALSLLLGCPTELGVPDAAGESCGDTVDCNGGQTCGELRACVLQHCEAEPSLLVPCDAGTMIDAFTPDAGVP